MKIQGNIIIFKSTPENYYKEFQGLKCNTARHITKTEEFRAFVEFIKHRSVNSKIRIITEFASGDQAQFERTITDITSFEGLWIFSWRHEP